MTQEQYDRMYAILDDLYELAISNDEAKSRMDDLMSEVYMSGVRAGRG